MVLTDTHCHLDFEKFDVDRAEVLSRARAEGVTRILIPGLDLASSRRAVTLAESHPMLFAAIGIHPSEVSNVESQMSDLRLSTFDEFRKLAQTPKVKAIGEIGLDYYWDSAPHEVQIEALAAQLDLAAELSLPVVLHLREAGDAPEGDCARDLLETLEPWAERLRLSHNPLAQAPGVLHSFSGNRSTAEKVLALNFYIGVTGPLTYKNAEARRELIASLPLTSLLIETDAPFLAPVPQRGRRNEPAFVRHIADKIAEIHMTTREQVAAITTANAARLFGWGG